MPILVVTAAAVFEISCGKKTDRQTDRQTYAAKNPTLATAFSVGDNIARSTHARSRRHCRRHTQFQQIARSLSFSF